MIAHLRLAALLVALGAAACGGAAAHGAPSSAPVPAAAPEGAVERTSFAAALDVSLGAMTRLPAGIYYRDIAEGSGVPARQGQEVLVSYIAYLANGTEVDRTPPGEPPIAFKLGDGVVIRGWDHGVRGMRVGGTRQLVVPPRHAYGARGTANVPPDAVMVFLIRLDGIR